MCVTRPRGEFSVNNFFSDSERACQSCVAGVITKERRPGTSFIEATMGLTKRQELEAMGGGDAINGLTIPAPPKLVIPDKLARAYPEMLMAANNFNRDNAAFFEKVVTAIRSRTG